MCELTARHGRGTAWARHAMCESAFTGAVVVSERHYGSLYRSEAEDAERIRAIILSNDVMVTTLMTGRNAMEIMWNREKVIVESAEDATLDNDYCNEMGGTDSCFRWKGQDEVGYGKKLCTYSTQVAIYLTELPKVIVQARKATSIFEAWKYLITDEILD